MRSAGPSVSRRSLLAGGAGLGAGAVTLGAAGCGTASPLLLPSTSTAGAAPVLGLHTQFGADASREAVVSWVTPASVGNPRVIFGDATAGFGSSTAAETTTYRDAQSGTELQVHHARLTSLSPDTDHVYGAVHDGAAAELGTLRTAPSGRAPLRFTSFGDQGTPTLGKQSADGHWVNDNLGSPAAGDVTAAVEQAAPLFHLVNGDLCYANLAVDRVRSWSDWLADTGRSSRHRPWMPAPGNHENERGNGPFGYGAYQALFALPDSGADPETRGLWYAFTAGSVRVVSLANDDVALQDGGNSYVHGYSGGAQARWLEGELARSSADSSIDWIVVCMHQVAVSTVDRFNGADLGVRQSWLPLFDRYGVDLVVCGHEHHYERSHPVRGALGTDTLTPRPVSMRTDVVDTSAGTVHMVIGGGGTSSPSNQLFFDPPACRVITAVGPADPATGKKTPVYVGEQAPWSAVRDREHSYGFATFDVDPGSPDGDTTIAVTYSAVVGPYGRTVPVDRFELRKARDRGRQ
ncbi:metallophosphoesterase family protein [Actinomycetospora endophytica]|uniref:Metallophosphoesterase family protein n=1 Tax=Actinomycetospora endophytica TaxID=2291215 RepID=A0ABS8P241_9PSEU|nr:metallophosphoesterase family protein [Actinomycetospora endophytica]MCD2192052.1 metallophosphoesterase family protein [Actinomycetospora endophytica]